ncbi:MAG: NlpC/P60 family protein, partial [Paraburkholderia graminis]
PDEIAPGDLIFFNTTGRPHSHVGIYVGKLRFVNAPSTGGTVRLDYLTNPYWAKRFDGIRRMAGPAAKPAPFDAPSYQAAAPQPERSAATGYGSDQGGARASAANTPSVTAKTGSDYAADAGLSQTTTARVTGQPRVTSNATGDSAALSTVSTAATRAPQADPFEPPPPAMTAAQLQARAAGAVSPTPVASTRASGYGSDSGSSGTPVQAQSTATARAMPQTANAATPDAIDAAADAFEPPPPASIAARQARLAQQTEQTGQAQRAGEAQADDGAVQIMRASTASRPTPAPSQTNDDPIARFANGKF